jgi:hypothetical protein
MDESNQPRPTSMDRTIFQTFKSRFTFGKISLLNYNK